MKLGKRKIWKRVMGVFLMAAITLDLSACVSNKKDYEDQACRLLEEKYGEQFEIVEYYGQDRQEEVYEVMAASNHYPDVLFEAKAACDGSYVSDEYIASRVCRLIEEQIEQNLGNLPGYVVVKVQAISKSIDSSNADMSIQEFVSIKSKNRFVIYLHYTPVDKNVEKAYQAIEDILLGMDCLNGTIQFYITDEKTLKQVQEYMEEHAKVDNEYKEIVEKIDRITIPFEQGTIQMSEGEFAERAGDRL